jgi:hypothetical protein
MLSIKEIKSIIEKGNVKFTVKGITEYRRGGEDNEYGDFPKMFRVNEEGDAIFEDTNLFGRGMNVTKLGPTCITLYDFNMLGKKTVGKINYKDITILNEIKDIPGFEGTLEALNEITIIK